MTSGSRRSLSSGLVAIIALPSNPVRQSGQRLAGIATEHLPNRAPDGHRGSAN